MPPARIGHLRQAMDNLLLLGAGLGLADENDAPELRCGTDRDIGEIVGGGHTA